MLMLDIAGGILLAFAIIILADILYKITLTLIVVIIGLVLVAWISPSVPREAWEFSIVLLIFGGLINTFYRCYKEFMKGWRES